MAAPAKPPNFLARINEERFWAKVDVRGDDECWPWTATRHQRGYGLVSVKVGDERSSFTSSRVAYALGAGLKEFPPREQQVCHSCDNPPCCNPAHLFLGTSKENLEDAALKGRLAQKLTEADVEAVLGSDETPDVRAERFGISTSMVGKIQMGRTWTHVTAGRARPTNPSFRPRTLTESDVRTIRTSSDSAKALAARFGVRVSTIYSVRSRKTWTNVV